jgi:hypothetical protein
MYVFTKERNLKKKPFSKIRSGLSHTRFKLCLELTVLLLDFFFSNRKPHNKQKEREKSCYLYRALVFILILVRNEFFHEIAAGKNAAVTKFFCFVYYNY